MAPPPCQPEQARVRVIDRIRVSPPPSEHEHEHEHELPLTFFDVAWLFTGPVERLFFFRHPDPDSTLPLLRSSLSLALRRFYPLAGTIRPSPATPHAPFLYSYSHGADALNFVVAQSDRPDDLDHLVARDPRDLAWIRPLVPQLPPPGDDGAFALAAVQATVFPGRGLCLGVSVHHAACDDASAMHFVRTWAAACRLGDDSQAAMPPPPVLDRSLVADPDDLRGKTLAGMMCLAPPPPPPPPPQEEEEEEERERAPLVMASFLLTRDQIGRIKDASAKASSFVAASALAWVCLLKSGSVGVAAAERSHMLFSAECRWRLTPPLPAEYLGNCLRPCFVEAATADLLSGETADGVAAAAAAIGRAIREMERGVLEGAEGWLGRVLSVLPERPMSVGGSPRHGVYDTDFGWGRPARVEMVSVEKTPGTVALAESPEGDGGIEVGVVLPRDAMDAFAACFGSI
ncbi:malonyl-coenzyme:anthocyanin 5-O-glucoside-6'''-O-malonyltransferase-like [Phragmites australis]|uniref:malonyl-coenzyme:anthocyanin 5-O-glucoside-6'''-O-malonyltransferase-like n=1 Tax=Phragmites australis TaxID=29695 RepID=UPI002D79E311|nr:malonyl-coenzyme:anthocyanin 5-O-glucoside-6'''-O-malonyltransferase-like [Phragmites australis]